MREPHLRSVDLNLLTALEALLTHLNVSRAAEAVNMSQPAMSRALARLRALFDDPLLVRAGGRLRPTPRAAALRGELAAVLAAVRGLLAPPDFDPLHWRADVAVAATDQQTALLLPRVIARLAREAPGVDVRVTPFTPDSFERLRDGRLALGFSINEQPLPPGLRSEPLYEDRFVTLLRPGHPAAADMTLERFAALDHVLVTVLGDGRGAMDDALAAHGLKRRVAVRLPHFFAAMAVVAETDLVVSLPASVADRLGDVFGLVRMPPPVARPPFTVVSVWSETLDADPGLVWLRGLLRETAAPAAA